MPAFSSSILRSRAFSLLEVLFAVTLFGAVVTFILSAQVGLVGGNRAAANMGQAMELGRCKMSEVEEKQLKLGFPEVEEKDESQTCCDDKEVPGFTCAWAVERVTLPDVQSLGGDAGLSSLLGGGLDLAHSAGISPGSIPSPGSMPLLNPMGSATLDFDAGLQGLGSSLQGSFGGGGAQGLLSMVFSIVYPSLKPLLEAAIRRITVTIRWHEGTAARDFVLMQYVTNPSRAGLAASMADAGAFGDGGGGPTNVGASAPGVRR
jgi:general secretion pathway protein I